ATLAFANVIHFLFHFKCCLAFQDKERLLDLLMIMQVLGSPWRHFLLHDTPRFVLQPVPTIASRSRLIIFAICSVLNHIACIFVSLFFYLMVAKLMFGAFL